MKFDLFDTLNTLHREFGNSAELSFTQENKIINIRVSVFVNKEWYHSRFLVAKEIIDASFTDAINIEFYKAIHTLKEMIKG